MSFAKDSVIRKLLDERKPSEEEEDFALLVCRTDITRLFARGRLSFDTAERIMAAMGAPDAGIELFLASEMFKLRQSLGPDPWTKGKKKAKKAVRK